MLPRCRNRAIWQAAAGQINATGRPTSVDEPVSADQATDTACARLRAAAITVWSIVAGLFGRGHATPAIGCGRFRNRRRKVTWPQARAFSVHLLTASGSFLAFLSLVAASEERWTAMFWWLGLALFVDGIDGPIARKLEVKEILPTWSGELLDNIIDYVTYVLIPAFALYQRGLMGEGLSFLSAAIIVVSSAIYYADTGMKTKENFFKGFPVVWNMVVFTLFVIEPGEWVSFAVVVIAGILTFVPMQFPASGTGRSGCGRSTSA